MLPDPRFIEWLADNQEAVTVFLTNGVKLSGVISHTYPGMFFLSRDGMNQMVYTHATATIMPADAIPSHRIPEIMGERRKAERTGQ
jgi:host factor-I protein